MRNLLSTLWILTMVPGLLAGCEAQTPAKGGEPTEAAAAPTGATSRKMMKPGEANRHAAFDAILQATVRDEGVDYAAVRDRHGEALGQYLDELAAVDAQQLPHGERLAYFINLYNATMIDVITKRQKSGYSTSDDEWKVFSEKLVRLNGETVSLNDLENEIIRKRFDEPRIHVALVCGARSCPPILPRAYRAEDLEMVLEANMKRFVRDTSRNVVSADRIAVSQIFDWYKDDFGGEKGLPSYLQRYAPEGVKVAGRKIEFLEYSWELNAAPPAKGKK